MNAACPITLLLATLLPALGGPAAPPVGELPRIEQSDPAWHGLAARLGAVPDGLAEFAEERTFHFRSRPVLLAGVARVSARHGLSLEYTQPEPRIVIVDRQGVLFREQGADRPAPADPRARVMNDAMLHVLRFDLARLAEDFDLRGRQDASTWQLVLRPRAPEGQRAVAQIDAEGDHNAVRRLVLRRADRQTIDIRIQPARALPAGFPAEEVRRYFRAAP